MEQFVLLKNQIIDELNSRSILSRERAQPLMNSFKTYEIVNPKYQFGSGTSIYNQSTVYDIPKWRNDLSQIYIKVTLLPNPTATDTTAPSTFALSIFSQITIRTKGGINLQTITPDYSLARFNDIYGTPLYYTMAAGVQGYDSILYTTEFINQNPYIAYVPLFFWFSENERNFLKTNFLEQLELVTVTNTSTFAMMELPNIFTSSVNFFTSLTSQVIMLYHDRDYSKDFKPPNVTTLDNATSKQLKNQGIFGVDNIQVFNPPRKILGHYNVNIEDIVRLPFKANSFPSIPSTVTINLLVRCNYPFYVMHIYAEDTNFKSLTIVNYQLTIGNTVVVNIDPQINYTMCGRQPSILQSNGMVSHWFSREKSRNTDSGATVFADVMSPATLTVTIVNSTYDSNSLTNYNQWLQAGYFPKLIVMEEYMGDYDIDDKGIIDINKGFNRLRFQNSNVGGVNLI